MTLSPFSHLLPEQAALIYPDGSDAYFLAHALDEAYAGLGRTHPNPSVGAVVVRNGEIVGKGHTQPAGGAHAEVVALLQAGERAHGATLYVTLEPCNHFGRTAPCVQHIVEAAISRVVVLVRDPNPHVVGGGVEQLQKAGVVVELSENVALVEKANAILQPFRRLLFKNRPYTVVKVATSKDGMLTATRGKQTALTGAATQLLVHRLRDTCDAVMVGAGTVQIDNPQLTVRAFAPPDARQPLRVVLDSCLRTSPMAHVYARSGAMVMHTAAAPSACIKKFIAQGIRLLQVQADAQGHVDIEAAVSALAQEGITSVLIEPGAQLLTSLVGKGCWDELWWLSAPDEAGAQGLRAPVRCETAELPIFIGDDALQIAAPNCLTLR